MTDEQTQPETATADSLATALETIEQQKATIEQLTGEVRYVTANRDAITVERQAMWRDYCRLRDVLIQAFPTIPDPAAKNAVQAALDAGQSH